MSRLKMPKPRGFATSSWIPSFENRSPPRRTRVHKSQMNRRVDSEEMTLLDRAERDGFLAMAGHPDSSIAASGSDIRTSRRLPLWSRRRFRRSEPECCTIIRASGMPARIASVHAPGVEPQDFHAVAEVFIGGEWHLVGATGMAREAAIAKIGIGRDAADVAFLTAYGQAVMNIQSVAVQEAT